MSSSAQFVASAPRMRPMLWMALAGAVMVAAPVLPAAAQGATGQATQQSHATQAAETVNQRIAYLHAQLKITPAEEHDWQAVAQAMRDEATTMEKLAAQKTSQSAQGMTAVEDLKTYVSFAQAHVAGLKNLTAAFQTLYDSMPASQQKLADQVFQSWHREHSENTASADSGGTSDHAQ